MTLNLKKNGVGIALPVKIIPGSSRNRIMGVLGRMLKITIAAAPEKGKANKELVSFLAKTLALAKSDIRIIAGEHDHRKQIQIDQLTPEELLQKLKPYINHG